jgi:hypothetical protein
VAQRRGWSSCPIRSALTPARAIKQMSNWNSFNRGFGIFQIYSLTGFDNIGPYPDPTIG